MSPPPTVLTCACWCRHSACDVIHTTDQYSYLFLSEPLGDEKSVQFTVKASNDAHIGFFDTQEHGIDPHTVNRDADDCTDDCTDGSVYTIDTGAQYEIVLSGWGGTQSVIRESAQGDNQVQLDTTGYLSADEFRQFWASAANGLIRLGTGSIVGSHTFLTFMDTNDFVNPNWAGVATGWGSEGDWVVCIPERCTGIHDAVTAGWLSCRVTSLVCLSCRILYIL
jgi:hypothetical protein